jgi:hypothetical protein
MANAKLISGFYLMSYVIAEKSLHNIVQSYHRTIEKFSHALVSSISSLEKSSEDNRDQIFPKRQVHMI